ncbi:MAG: PIN domain-containing protein [Chitinivibrionales bacterium]|nr:PIN domain-containing protein [Chitinivibrionales bacterium]
MIPSVWVDTSFLYAMFVETDQNHAAAQRVWREATVRRIPCLSSELVYGELGSLFAYRFGHRIAFSRMSLLLDSVLIKQVFADSRVQSGALKWWRRYQDQSFSMVDCVSFEFMRLLGLTHALSFDTDFSVAGFTTVREPDTLPC